MTTIQYNGISYEEEQYLKFLSEYNLIRKAINEHDLDTTKLNGVMLAGGAINSVFTRRSINDLDFYCKSVEDQTRLIAYLEGLKYKTVHETDNAITFEKNLKGKIRCVQVIKKFVSYLPEEILETFDFTVVQGLFDFDTNYFTFSSRFLIDCARRDLVYTSTSKYPICALYRTKKYQERGYHLSGITMVAISLAINALKFQTYADLKDQLLGIDTAVFREIINNDDLDKKFDISADVQSLISSALEHYFSGGYTDEEDSSGRNTIEPSRVARSTY